MMSKLTNCCTSRHKVNLPLVEVLLPVKSGIKKIHVFPSINRGEKRVFFLKIVSMPLRNT